MTIRGPGNNFWYQFAAQTCFAQKVFEVALAKERFPRKGAKTQRKPWKRGSALRLCGFA
jgi:hypothetical protein